MKHQYVGDISDFEKYAILRALSPAADLPLAVCWMLTEGDDTGEGARTDYLKEPQRYRQLDPYVFDRLARIVSSGERSLASVEAKDVLHRARFFARTLQDTAASRFVYFRDVWASLQKPSLLFFDPDIGLAGASMSKGRRRSSMYIFDDELREGFRHGHSLVVFDHWKRVQRLPYLKEAFARLSDATGATAPFALWGTQRVVFFVLPQDDKAAVLERASRDLAVRWQPMLTCTSANDLQDG
jgi:hypothetical protein